MEIYLTKTKKGFPALWEEGGGYRNTGTARVIANSDGSAKKAVFIRTGGSLACSKHALFVVEQGDIIVEVDRHNCDYEIFLYRISNIIKDENENYIADATQIAHFSEGEWDNDDIAEKYKDVIEAGISKSHCYHCRESHYSQ